LLADNCVEVANTVGNADGVGISKNQFSDKIEALTYHIENIQKDVTFVKDGDGCLLIEHRAF
jgi:hypothetical protein